MCGHLIQDIAYFQNHEQYLVVSLRQTSILLSSLAWFTDMTPQAGMKYSLLSQLLLIKVILQPWSNSGKWIATGNCKYGRERQDFDSYMQNDGKTQPKVVEGYKSHWALFLGLYFVHKIKYNDESYCETRFWVNIHQENKNVVGWCVYCPRCDFNYLNWYFIWLNGMMNWLVFYIYFARPTSMSFGNLNSGTQKINVLAILIYSSTLW